jgi:hypothetical protein
MIERRYEKGIGASLFWIIWFPVVYWMLSLFTTLVAFPKVMLKRKRGRARWVSPDRGIGGSNHESAADLYGAASAAAHHRRLLTLIAWVGFYT